MTPLYDYVDNHFYIDHPDALTAWALDTTGRRTREIPVRREGERLLFDCLTEEGPIYYELVMPELRRHSGLVRRFIEEGFVSLRAQIARLRTLC